MNVGIKYVNKLIGGADEFLDAFEKHMEVKCRNCDKSLPEVGTRSHCSSVGRWPGIRVWIVSFVTSVCFHQGKILVLLLVLRLLSQFSLRVSISPSLRKLLVGLKNVPQGTSGWFPKKKVSQETGRSASAW